MNEDILRKRGKLNATYFDLLCIVGNLVLSLKHPMNNGASAEVTRKIGRRMAELLIDAGLRPPEDVMNEWKQTLKLEGE